MRDNVYDDFVILTQEIRKNLAGFTIFVIVGYDAAVPVVNGQVSIARALSRGTGERLDRR